MFAAQKRPEADNEIFVHCFSFSIGTDVVGFFGRIVHLRRSQGVTFAGSKESQRKLGGLLYFARQGFRRKLKT